MSQSLRVLLIEDNPGDARLIREALRETGPLHLELLHQERLEPACRLLAAEPIEVVLLDLSLPDAHGLETLRRTLEAAPDAAIVVLTGLDDENVAIQAVQAGAQDYLVKGQVEGPLLARALRYALERKRQERERRRLLRSEQEARAVAESAVRGRDEVLRVVSHDLGNSLSAVAIHASLLERARAHEGPEDEVRKRAQAIRNLVHQMHELRQDLLDAASLEAGRLSMYPLPQPVANVVQMIADTAAELTADREIAFELKLDNGLPAIQADQQRLHQVLTNLIGNALKFTPAGGRVWLEAAAVPGFVRFTVRDNGPGISPEDLDHIFDRFWKGGRHDRHGAGLGLAIAEGIVRAHGGSIWVESALGRGSAFHFTIPVAGEPASGETERHGGLAR